jgi:hypothetical protein
MAQPKKAAPIDPLVERQERINEAMSALRPKIDAMVLRMVESIVDTPEAEELSAASEFRLRDAGLEMLAAVQQAGLTSRKKRGTKGPVKLARTVAKGPSSSTISRTDS